MSTRDYNSLVGQIPSPEEVDEWDIPVRHNIPPALAGMRLDLALVALFESFSRSRLQQWIKAGQVRLNGQLTNAKATVWSGDWVELQVPPDHATTAVIPQPMTLQWVYQDAVLGVLHKPPGLIVHPGNGHASGTLQNGLLFDDARLAALPRCGIVHRLDKDTSGLMVVARTLGAHAALVQQLQERTVHRHYWALVQGHVLQDGTVDAPIGRHPAQRTRMAVVSGGRMAVTHYKVREHLPLHTLLECHLETGRTHQIRVHLQHLGFPLAADPVYGGRSPILDGPSQRALTQFGRQALHAFRLGLIHPEGNTPLQFEIPMEEDMSQLIQILRHAPVC